MFPCSRNAHDKAVLVRRAQSGIISLAARSVSEEERDEWQISHQKN